MCSSWVQNSVWRSVLLHTGHTPVKAPVLGSGCNPHLWGRVMRQPPGCLSCGGGLSAMGDCPTPGLLPSACCRLVDLCGHVPTEGLLLLMLPLFKLNGQQHLPTALLVTYPQSGLLAPCLKSISSGCLGQHCLLISCPKCVTRMQSA